MPTYEYRCDNGHIHIETRSMNSDQKTKTCVNESCGLELKRVFSAPPITFKGSGFSAKSG